MRWWLALLLVLPMAQAAQWEDAPADQEYGRTLAITDAGPQEHWENIGQYGWYPQADVLAASLTETASHIIFDVTLAATDADPMTEQPPGSDAPYAWKYEWTFDFKGERLVAGFERFGDDPDDVWFHILERLETGPGFISISYRAIWWAEAKDDAPGYRAVVPKWVFRDSDHIPIREGDKLEDLRFGAADGAYFHNDAVPCPNTQPQQPWQLLIGSDCGWRVRDLMQNGDTLGDFEVKLTPPGVGHLFMRMEDPIRLSNGLATTYLFEAVVHNLEDTADDVLVQVTGIPKKWDVYSPAVVSFAGKGQQTIPIAVSVPFEHQHGVENFMELSVVSSRDSTAALTTWFGVFFADPAQPGGHHNTLYFHSDPESDFWGWMNTDQNDEEGAKNPLAAWDVEFIEGTRYGWEIWLSPGLGMGLDFDTAKTGELVFDLETPLQFDGDVNADLVLWDWDTDARTLVASGTSPASFAGGAPTEVRIDLTPEAFADRIRPQPHANLVLLVNATSATPTPPVFFRFEDGPKFHTQDATMRLPLIDYHDDVDLSGLQVAAFNMEAINGTFRSVNPGKTSVIAFNVTNLLDTKATIDWELKGVDPFIGWSKLGPTTSKLVPGGNGTVVIRYTPPESASKSDIAEFVLIGKAREDTNRQVFARMTFFVNTNKDIPDESAYGDELENIAAKSNAAGDKESPGIPLLAALAAIAIVLRRR